MGAGASFGMEMANKMMETGFNTINKAIDYNFNKKFLYKQQRFAKEMYEKQLKDDLQYNDPTYQVARMKGSGLNPYLLAENGGFGGMSFQTPSSPSGGSIGGYGIQGGFNPQDVALRNAQIENVEADTLKKKKEADKLGTEINLNEITLKNLDDMQKAQIYKMDAEISNIITNTQLQFMTTQKVEVEIRELNEIIKRTIEETKVKEEEAKNIEADTKCKYIYAKLETNRVALEAVQTKLNAMGINLSAQGLKLDTAKFKFDATMQTKLFELKTELQKHNINIDWANFAVNTLSTAVETAGAVISKGALIPQSRKWTETQTFEGRNAVPEKRTYTRTRND